MSPIFPTLLLCTRYLLKVSSWANNWRNDRKNLNFIQNRHRSTHTLTLYNMRPPVQRSTHTLTVYNMRPPVPWFLSALSNRCKTRVRKKPHNVKQSMNAKSQFCQLLLFLREARNKKFETYISRATKKYYWNSEVNQNAQNIATLESRSRAENFRMGYP